MECYGVTRPFAVAWHAAFIIDSPGSLLIMARSRRETSAGEVHVNRQMRGGPIEQLVMAPMGVAPPGNQIWRSQPYISICGDIWSYRI